MKGFAVGILIILAIVGGGAYYYFRASTTNTPSNFKSGDEKLIGTVQPVTGNSEYQYIVISGGKTTGITSNSVDLSKYSGKKVEILGQYSGTTMYADSIIELTD